MQREGIRNQSYRRHLIWMVVTALVSVSVLMLLGLRYNISPSGLLRQTTDVNGLLLCAVAVASLLFHVFVGAHKLWCVMRAMDVEISYPDMLRLRLGSGPLRFLIPLKAGEAVNVMFFWRHKRIALGRSTGGVAFDRGINVVGSTVWLLVGLLLFHNVDLRLGVFLLVLFGVAFTGFLFFDGMHEMVISLADRMHDKLGRFARGLLSPLTGFSLKRRALFVLYGIIFQARPIVVCYLLFRAFGIEPEASSFIAYTSIAVFAGHVPSIAGIGPREAAIVSLFRGLAPEATLLSVGLLLSLAVHVMPIVVGLPWVGWLLRRVTAAAEGGAQDLETKSERGD